MRRSTKSLPSEADAFGPRFRISDEYTMGNFLGGGSYGKVFECQNRITGEMFAVKSVSTRRLRPDEQRALAQEVEVLSTLHHPNIVRYITTIQTRNTLHIVMQFMECGAISKSLASFGPFTPQLSAVMTRQVLDGLAYLHDQGVIHRDIKCDNILLDKSGHVKLADFGIAVRAGNMAEEEMGMGTPYWMAPEIIQLVPATSACDIWSIGCTIIEMMTGAPPYYECEKAAAIFRIVKDEEMPIPSSIPDEVSHFLKLCFKRDPTVRPTATELLEHEWLTSALLATQEDTPSVFATSSSVSTATSRTTKPSHASMGRPHRHSLPGQMYDSVNTDLIGASERVLSQLGLKSLGESENEAQGAAAEPSIKVSPVVTSRKIVSPRSNSRVQEERDARLAQYRESIEDADFKDLDVPKLELSLKERSFRDLFEADVSSNSRETLVDEKEKAKTKVQALVNQIMGKPEEADKSGAELFNFISSAPGLAEEILVGTSTVWMILGGFDALSVVQQLWLLKSLVKVTPSKTFLELLLVAGVVPVLTKILSAPGYSLSPKPSPLSELKHTAADLITFLLRTNPLVLHTFVASGGADPLVALCKNPSIELGLIALDGIQRIFNETLAPIGSQRRKSFIRATKHSVDGTLSKNDLCLLFSRTALAEALAGLGERLQSDEGRRESFQYKIAPLGALAEVCHVFLVFSRESVAAKTYISGNSKVIHFILKTLQMRWTAILTNRNGEELNDDDLDVIRALLACIKHLASEPSCLESLEGYGTIEALISIASTRLDASSMLRKSAKKPVSPETLNFVNEVHNFAFVVLYMLIRLSASRQERAVACGLIKLAVRAVLDKTLVKPFAMQVLCDLCTTGVNSDYVKSLLLKDGALDLLMDSLVVTSDDGAEGQPKIWQGRALQGFSQLLSVPDAMMLKSAVHREVERYLLSPRAIVRYCELFRKSQGQEFEMITKLLLRIMEANPKLAEAGGRSGVIVSEIAARFAAKPKAEVQIELLKLLTVLTGRHTDLENLLLDHNLYIVVSVVLDNAKQNKLVVVATHAEQLLVMWKPVMDRLTSRFV